MGPAPPAKVGAERQLLQVVCLGVGCVSPSGVGGVGEVLHAGLYPADDGVTGVN